MVCSKPAQLSVMPLSAEAYAKGRRASWSHVDNPARNSAFDEHLRKVDTCDPCFYGRFTVKMDCYGRKYGAGALIICTTGGQIELGFVTRKCNGATTLCGALGMTNGSEDRQAIHNQPVVVVMGAHLVASAAAADAVAHGFAKPGCFFEPITEECLNVGSEEELYALATKIATCGFAVRADDGPVMIFFASAPVGTVARRPLRLSGGAHPLESKEPGRWGSFIRVGLPGGVALAPHVAAGIKEVGERMTIYNNTLVALVGPVTNFPSQRPQFLEMVSSPGPPYF